jgi:tellurium resistance protein TerD
VGINLEKGQRTNVSQQKFNIGLSWDANESESGQDFDLDASVFGLGENGKIIEERYFVFYNNLESPDGSIIHTGDNQTGAGDGDDETIAIDLSKINPKVKELRVVVTIHDAISRKQNFGQVRNSKFESMFLLQMKKFLNLNWMKISLQKLLLSLVGFIIGMITGNLKQFQLDFQVV